MQFENELKRILRKELIRKKLGDQINIKIPRVLVHSLQWISVGYASALYFAGKKLGTDVIAKGIAGADAKTVLRAIGKLFRDFGLGELELAELSDSKAIVRIRESSTAYGMRPIGKPVCFFEAGLLAGVLEGRLKRKVSVNEVLCGGLGDEFEEFLIRFG
jgi:hypothetical protein